MAGNRKKRGQSDKNHFKSYELNGVAAKNKIRKLQRHLKGHSEDEQSFTALENAKRGHYRPRQANTMKQVFKPRSENLKAKRAA